MVCRLSKEDWAQWRLLGPAWRGPDQTPGRPRAALEALPSLLDRQVCGFVTSEVAQAGGRTAGAIGLCGAAAVWQLHADTMQSEHISTTPSGAASRTGGGQPQEALCLVRDTTSRRHHPAWLSILRPEEE